MKVRYSYLKQQFEKSDDLWRNLKEFVSTGDFTLGKPLEKFEKKFATLMGVKHAIGVNSGTDALKIALKALGIKSGDEIITSANTFVATVGAICELGAIPQFVDCDDTFCMNVEKVESKINKKTKAIIPVHFSGYVTNMSKLVKIAKKYNLPIVEDACQSILGSIDGKLSGTWGVAGAFSLHPLKNLNVWSDGGMIITNRDDLNSSFRLLRNHGLKDRDTIEILGYNSRLDTLQAVVGNWLIPSTKQITNQRIKNAKIFDQGFKKIKEITIPPRPKKMKIVYHLYIVFAENRDKLLKYCIKKGIEAKIHYPTPIYRQKAVKHFGYRAGDFPVTDRHAKRMISFPCDQHLSKSQIKYIIDTVFNFYKGKK